MDELLAIMDNYYRQEAEELARELHRVRRVAYCRQLALQAQETRLDNFHAEINFLRSLVAEIFEAYPDLRAGYEFEVDLLADTESTDDDNEEPVQRVRRRLEYDPDNE